MLKTKEISYVIDLLEDHDGKLRSVDDLVDQSSTTALLHADWDGDQRTLELSMPYYNNAEDMC